jgi:predicted HicB family RNase H-like nuclease
VTGRGVNVATIEHHGSVARIELDQDEKILHGRVININDVVTFEAASAPQLLREFKRSMEDYFAFCKKRGEEPEKPFSGKFVLRVDPAVHRAIAVAADREAKSINKWAEETLAKAAAG